MTIIMVSYSFFFLVNYRIKPLKSMRIITIMSQKKRKVEYRKIKTEVERIAVCHYLSSIRQNTIKREENSEKSTIKEHVSRLENN